jgi:hypothetical protein
LIENKTLAAKAFSFNRYNSVIPFTSFSAESITMFQPGLNLNEQLKNMEQICKLTLIAKNPVRFHIPIVAILTAYMHMKEFPNSKNLYS